MRGNHQDQLVFAISTEFAQSYAERFLGRRLTSNELLSFKKSLKRGLMHDIETFFEVLFERFLEKRK